MGSQGYHGNGELASHLEHDGIVGPTTAHATINAAVQLTSADSGSAISITNSAAGAYNIYLPVTTAGLHFRFLVLSELVGDVSIVASNDSIRGTLSQITTPAAISGATILMDTSVGTTIGIVIELHGIDDDYWWASINAAGTINTVVVS